MRENHDLTLLRRIEERANAATASIRTAIPVGPFLALLDPSTEMTWINYAVPVAELGGDSEVAESLEALKRVFAEHERTPRFELTDRLWPDLPAHLERTGLRLEARHPTMLCAPQDFQPFRAADVTVRLLQAVGEADDAPAGYLSLLRRSFGVEEQTPAPPEEIAKLRSDIASGLLRCAVAELGGLPAGGGCTMGDSEIRELAGVGTAPEWRRRGVASTLSGFLTAEHFGCGGEIVWLSAGDAVAQAVYARLGFRTVAERLNYILG